VQSLAKRENMSKDYVEQLFLKLKRAGIVKSVKGVRGGYMLAKEAADITLRAVIEALEGQIYETFCCTPVRKKIVCMYFGHCSVQPVWFKLKDMIDDFFEKITLATLMQDEQVVAKQLNVQIPVEDRCQETAGGGKAKW